MSFILTDDGLIFWPYCKVKGCDNRQCKRLSSEYCYPHTLGLSTDFSICEHESGHNPAKQKVKA